GYMQLSLILCECSFSLPQCFAKRPRIDLEEEISLIHICAFIEFHGQQWARDLRLYFDGRIGLHIANRLYLDRHRFFSGLSDSHRYRRERRSAGLCLWRRAAADGEKDNECGNNRPYTYLHRNAV